MNKRYSGVTSFSILRIVIVAVLLVLLLFVQTSHAATSVPTKMNFQGRLTDSSGNIMANGTYNMRFRIYTVSTGGSSVWSEDRLVASSQGVTVTNGLFSVQLGDITSLPASVFNTSALYFEIELPTPGTATTSSPSWTEGAMTPRNQLATSAYAYNAETLDGIDGASFAQLGSANVFTATNSVDVSNANAFQVKNGATSLFNVDTASSQIAIGTSDTIGTVLVLDTKTGSGDPTGTNGAMYYNSNSGKFRCYQSGSWTDCVPAGAALTMQGAYDNSTSPATITTSSATKGVKIAAGTAPTADLFTVDNTGQAVATDGVDGVAVNYVGGTGAIEGAGVRVDYTPGGTSGSVWNGLKIVANATGAASGVTSNGILIEGPSAPGAGTETGLSIGGGFDIGVDIASGGLQMAAVVSEPSAPAAGNMKVYAKDIAGRMILKTVGPSGLDTPYQPGLFANNIAMILPSTGATISTWGMPNTTVGTATTPTIANTNFKSAMRRVLVTSAGTANSASELRSAQMLVWRGNGAGLGGFFYAARFSVNSTTSNQRLFSGLINSTAATSTTAAPSAIINMIGVGWDSAVGNLQMMSNDGTGTATKVDLGASFPTNTTTAVYELIMYAAPNGSSVGYRVVRLDTGATTSGTISADLPASGLMLSHHQYMNNGGTAAAVALEVNRVYVESDY